MINYNCKQLAIVLAKKWYIMIGVTILFCFVSLPLSQLSYNRATDNYRNITEREGEVLYNFFTTYEFAPTVSSTLQIYIACLNDSSYMNRVINTYNYHFQWEDVRDKINFDYLENENLFSLSILQASDDEIKNVMNLITVSLGKYLHKSNLPIINFTEKDTNKYQTNVDISKLLAEPTDKPSNLKILLTAAIAGITFSCLIILMRDYIARGSAK
ncbi:hypothetical protein D7X48_20435 [bacterium D16-50]|nr:hypothetical protein D7X48_20435 [bacterium D16-50]